MPLDLKFYRGDTLNIIGFRIKDDSDYVDLTGRTAYAQIRQTILSSAVLKELTVEVDPNQEDNPGLVNVIFPDTLWNDLALGLEGQIGVWDLQLSSDSETTTYLRGDVFLTTDVTREQ
jgi:hypothetical protein